MPRCLACSLFLIAVFFMPALGAAAGTAGVPDSPFVTALAAEVAVLGVPWQAGFQGAAAVLRRDGAGWALEQLLQPDDLGRLDHFGSSVAVSGDEAFVAAPWQDVSRGAVYVYARQDGRWFLQEKLVAGDRRPDLQFGRSVTVTDGVLTVAARDGSLYRFGRTPDGWQGREKVPASGASMVAADQPAASDDDRNAFAALLAGSTDPFPSAALAVDDILDWVNATDGVFEDRVEITWASAPQDNIVFKIIRYEAGVPEALTILSSDDRVYNDTTGDRGTVYSYCVLIVDMLGAEGPELCDNGSRVLRAPGNVKASDGTLTAGVQVTWDDRSASETSYVLYRNGAVHQILAANRTATVDSTVAAGVVATYEVEARDESDRPSARAGDSGFRGFVLPPLDFQATDGRFGDRVVLTWRDQAPDETGYRISRNGVAIATVAPDSQRYVDPGLAADQVFAYSIETEGPGPVYSVAMADSGGTLLPAPLNVQATDGVFDDRVEVTWSDTGGFADGYEILRDAAVIGTVGAGVRAYRDESANLGATYTYCVRATAVGGGVSAEGCDDGSRSIVLAPTGVTATDGTHEDRTEISWQSTSTTVVLFKVFRNNVFIKSVAGGRRSFGDRTGTTGLVYDYRVEAVTAVGNGATSATETGYRELAAPGIVSASRGGFEDRVEIGWTDNSQVENGFVIQRIAAGDTTEVGRRKANVTAFTDRTGVPGTEYEYRVAAFDTTGQDFGVSAFAVATGSRSLVAPTGVQASDGTFEAQVEVAWVDNSSAEDGYHIYRDGVPIGTTEDNATEFIDPAPPFNTPASYEVRAFDAYGESSADADAGGTTILPPESFNASDVYTDRIELKWIDQSAIEDGYKVYRGGQVVATTGAGVTTFTDLSPGPGEAPLYGVETYKAAAASARATDTGLRALPDAMGAGAGQSLVFYNGNFPTSYRFGTNVAMDENDILVAANPDNSGTFDAVGVAHIFTFGADGQASYSNLFSQNVGGFAHGNGRPLGISNSRAIVGAYLDNYTPLFELDSGSAFIYTRSGNAWTASAKLTASDHQSDDWFGWAVAIDGNVAIVGAPHAEPNGAAYIYRFNGTAWSQSPVLAAPAGVGADFGNDVGISGNSAIVGSVGGSSRAMIYDWDGSAWVSQQIFALDASAGDSFGFNVGISGDYAVATAPGADIGVASNAGAAYVFERQGGIWQQVAKLVASDGQASNSFGTSVAIEGDRVVIGSLNGDTGVANAGSAYLFERQADRTWGRPGELAGTRSESWAVGAANGANNNGFGMDVGLSGERVVIGAPLDDNDYGSDYGTTFVYTVVVPPSAFTASDGTVDNAVQLRWLDQSQFEDGFNIYRDGVKIDDVEANIEFFNDTGADPGRTHLYAVAAFSLLRGAESTLQSDFGWRPPNGSITGRVNSQAGAGVGDVQVTLEPAPGRALLLDGVGGHLTLADHGEFDFTANKSFTIESWFRCSGSDRQPRILSRVDPADTEGPRTFDLGFQRATGSLFFVVSDGTNAARVITGREDLNDDVWHQVSAVFDATDDSIRVYVDGVLEGSAGAAGLGNIASASDITIGGFGPDTWFGGGLDELRIWGIARTAAEIGTNWSLRLQGDEPGLLGYWPMDGGIGEVITDYAVGRATYGRLAGGVYWSTDIAPVDASARTDNEGSFVITGIRYGSQASFRVRPSYGLHHFSPATLPVNLSNESPVWNDIVFSDVTSFTVSGSVRFAGTDCVVPEVQILVDGGPRGASDKNGKFAVSLDAGDHVVEARLGGRTFMAVDRGDTLPSGLVTLQDLDGNVADVEFFDTTLHTLSGRVAGGCDRYIGDIIVNLRSGNDCYTRSDTITAGEASYAFDLPPQTYFASATVLNVAPELVALGLRADILNFYQNLGEREVDLAAVADTTLDFVYRAPLAVEITERSSGLSLFEVFGPAGCGPDERLQLEDGTLLPAGLPLIPQLQEIFLTISVAENYGPNDRCPLDAGTLTIYDEFFDRQDSTVTVQLDSLGRAEYRTFTSTPSLIRGRTDGLDDRSYQKLLRATATVPGRAPAWASEWALVTGHVRAPGAEFVSIPVGDMPLIILRDPPGDGSYAYLEEEMGTSETTNWEKVSFGGGAGAGVVAQFGVELTTFVGLGVGIISERVAETTLRDNFMVGRRNYEENKTQTWLKTLQRVTTENNQLRWWGGSDADPVPGRDGDLYIGTGLTMLFAKVGEVGLDGCVVTRSSSIGFEPDSIRTTFAFTERHIRDILIPDLEASAAGYPADSDSQRIWQGRAVLWQAHLADNQRRKDEADVVLNRSFSAGAGIQFAYSEETLTSEEKYFTTYFDNEGAVGLALDVIPGFENELTLQYEAFREDLRTAQDDDSLNAWAVGYELRDDDAGDSFSVDVLDDLVNKSYAFRVRGGRSSCPYEPWSDADNPTAVTMVQRDRPALFMPVNELIGVPPEETAVFTLQIVNESDEARDYTVSLSSNSNPGGAIVRLNGSPLADGLTFSIDGAVPGANNVHEATLTVERGPTRFRYPDLELNIAPACGPDPYVTDAINFSVTFAGCSDVRLSGPAIRPGWTYTAQNGLDDLPLDLVLDRYELFLTPPNVVSAVGVEYRRLGTGQNGPGPWVEIATSAPGTTDIYDNGDVSPDTIIPWIPGRNALGDPVPLTDGVYELRGFTDCSAGGRGYSAVVTGTIDRSAPQVFGTPEPGDQQLSLGEDIRLAFNEPIDCGSATADSVTLHYLDGPATGQAIPLDIVCNGTAVILVPLADAAELEGRRLRASVSAMTDLVGNAMSARVWDFDYRQSLFTWSETQLVTGAPLGRPGDLTTEIVNGSPATVQFAVTGRPGFLTGVSPASGELVSGARRELALTIDPTLPAAVYAGEVTVVATRAAGTDTVGVAVLAVTLDVSCGGAPEWIPAAAGFEYSMTIVAQLQVDGVGVPFADPADRVAAFVGEELRGVGQVGDGGAGDLVFLTVYANAAGGDLLRFEVWDDDQCRLYRNTLEAIPFVAETTVGTVDGPQVLTATDAQAAGMFALSAGWNWFSTNVVSASMAVDDVLASLAATAGDVIKSKTEFATFDPQLGWTGGLTTLDNASGYMIRLAQPGTVYQPGAPVDPLLTPIPLAVGWNWVGYTPAVAEAIGPALTDLEQFLDGDEIAKGQSQFAQWNAPGWVGNLAALAPGQGYRLELDAAALPAAFTYPANSGTAAQAARPGAVPDAAQVAEGTEKTSNPTIGFSLPDWEFDHHRFQYNMAVVTVLRGGSAEWRSGETRVAAFVDGECRGVARAVHVPGVDRYLAFVTVHGNQRTGETVTLQIYNGEDKVLYDAGEEIAFVVDTVVGSLQEPFAVEAAAVAAGSIPQVYRLGGNHPNPFNPLTTIDFDLPRAGRVVLKIYDVRGLLVRTLIDESFNPGRFAAEWNGTTNRGARVSSGVYFYRIQADSFTDVKKMVLLK